MSQFHKRLIPSGWQWEQTRRRILDRDGWRCRSCGRYGHECDHIIPLMNGGAVLRESNLQTLCSACHVKKTRGEMEVLRGLPNEFFKWKQYVLEQEEVTT